MINMERKENSCLKEFCYLSVHLPLKIAIAALIFVALPNLGMAQTMDPVCVMGCNDAYAKCVTAADAKWKKAQRKFGECIDEADSNHAEAVEACEDNNSHNPANEKACLVQEQRNYEGALEGCSYTRAVAETGHNNAIVDCQGKWSACIAGCLRAAQVNSIPGVLDPLDPIFAGF
jgi:hypothetical protein